MSADTSKENDKETLPQEDLNDGNGILARLAADYGENDEESVDSESDSSSDSESGSDSEESSDHVSTCPSVQEGDSQPMTVGLTMDASKIEEVVPDGISTAGVNSIFCQKIQKVVPESFATTAVESLICENIENSRILEEERVDSSAEATITIADDVNALKYRSRKNSTSSSSSSSESSIDLSSDISDSEAEGEKDIENGTSQSKKKIGKQPPRVKGELSLDDLGPIVDLQISVPENKVEPIGTVVNVVGCLVTVESFENKPALDLSTVLFIEEGRKAMGHVFEVFGRTRQPWYCVRFNSAEHIKERGVEVGMTVYAAPGTEHTRYVFLAQLERLRGTDASWKDDHEVPDDLAEYSDDEMEKIAKNKNRKPRPKKTQPTNRSLPPPSESFDTTDGNRFARKRNFAQDNGIPPALNGCGPRPFGPGYNYYGYQPPGPPRPRHDGPMNSHRPIGVENGFCPPNFYAGAGYAQDNSYGLPRFTHPPPANPFSVGGAAVSYRPPYYNNYYNQGWVNYNYQQQQYPNNYWPTTPGAYDQQAGWPGYQYPCNLPPFTTPPPPPPAPVTISAGPVKATVPATIPVSLS